MRRISRAEFERDAEDVERAALSTPGIDAFCSSPDWMFAAQDAWDVGAEPWLLRTDGGYVAFLEEESGLLRVLAPFDRMWGYSCPLLGESAAAFASAFPKSGCPLALITGLQESSPNWSALLAALGPTCDLGIGEPQHRWQARLDGYWERRPRKLRQELRRARRRADERRLAFERGEGDVDELYARVLDVERRSWKGPSGTGLIHEEMRAFYAALFRRLHARGRLRLVFARLGGEDVGYIAGGVIGDQYRGLQFSFDDRFRDLSPGNLMQAHEIDALIEEGFSLYDLGIDIAYKARWADERVETSTLVIRARG